MKLETMENGNGVPPGRAAGAELKLNNHEQLRFFGGGPPRPSRRGRIEATTTKRFVPSKCVVPPGRAAGAELKLKWS